MSQGNVVNPGLVNVADQGDGPTSADQAVQTGTSTNPGPLVQASEEASVDQPVTTGPSQSEGPTVPGGEASPQSPSTVDTTENTVANQIYGQGDPANVYV
jgi:hypothetical protein